MSSSPTETLVDVTMPQMGVSVAEGTVVEWRKQPGDWIESRARVERVGGTLSFADVSLTVDDHEIVRARAVWVVAA